MDEQPVFLVAMRKSEDTDKLVKGLGRAGIADNVFPFESGQKLLDFIFVRAGGPRRVAEIGYVLIIEDTLEDIDGLEVVEQLKRDAVLKKIPVVMLGDGRNPERINHCYRAGCGVYMNKSASEEFFPESIKKLGLFLSVIRVPQINKAK